MVPDFKNNKPKMATALEDFPTWLKGKLQELNTDENIFGEYIQSIVDSDETSEEKMEALQGILSEIVENESEIAALCNEILEKWQQHKSNALPSDQPTVEDVDTKLVKLLESQSLATTKQKKYTEEEKKIREAILLQYSQMTDDENEEDEPGQASGGGSGDQKENGMEKNTNFQSVVQAEKEKREQARLDSQKKKEKDKEDREKQKQMREEKKEKRKTQKGERRR